MRTLLSHLSLSLTHTHTHTLYAPLARGPYSQGSGGLDRQSNETDNLHEDRRQTWTLGSTTPVGLDTVST